MTEKNKLKTEEETVKNMTEQTKKKEADKEAKSLSDEEKKVAKKATEKKISKEDAQKEVAREEVKSETGYSAEALASVGRTVLKTQDAFSRPDVVEATGQMKHLKGNAVEGMLEKMTDSKVAQKIVQAGLGSEFVSTGAGGLEQGGRTVLEKQREFGGAEGMEGLLAKMVLFGNGMSLEEIRKMTPEKLKEVTEQLAQKQKSENSEKPENKTESQKEAKTETKQESKTEKQKTDPAFQKALAERRGKTI